VILHCYLSYLSAIYIHIKEEHLPHAFFSTKLLYFLQTKSKPWCYSTTFTFVDQYFHTSTFTLLQITHTSIFLNTITNILAAKGAACRRGNFLVG
jgi:hypothetical protein